jgi:hypothetical protein
MTAGYLFGAGALLVFWVFSYIVTRKVAPWALAISESTVGGQLQGVLSVSKFQALVWTLITLFTYTSVFGARFLASEPGAALRTLPSIPINLLVLMGLSVATAAGAKRTSSHWMTALSAPKPTALSRGPISKSRPLSPQPTRQGIKSQSEFIAMGSGLANSSSRLLDEQS